MLEGPCISIWWVALPAARELRGGSGAARAGLSRLLLKHHAGSERGGARLKERSLRGQDRMDCARAARSQQHISDQRNGETWHLMSLIPSTEPKGACGWRSEHLHRQKYGLTFTFKDLLSKSGRNPALMWIPDRLGMMPGDAEQGRRHLGREGQW